MNFFDTNIKELEKCGAHFLELDEAAPSDILTYVGTDEQGVKWFQNKQDLPVFLTNDIDKSNLPSENLKQIIFFFGIASIDEILEVSRYAHPESFYVIIEPSESLLQYALNYEDFRRLENINYMVAAIDSHRITKVMGLLTSGKTLVLLKKPIFYFNSYYRKHDLGILKEYIVQIRDAITHKFFKVGNSIHDSLLGLIHNMQNLNAMSAAPDVAILKDKFKNLPAFIVAAGPSLDKNIEYLKKVNNKGIIIAVDTIAEKLVKSGIKPHFIASVERVKVWEYFFENKPSYYQDSYIVAPPVVEPKVFAAFNGKIILPIRESVREYRWFREMLQLSEDHMVWMGASCAHVALGWAVHIGASPITLVGQDLAYGEDVTKTHASETEYDIKPEDEPEEILTVEGYYGGQVKTQSIWNEFRIIFEDRIRDLSLEVINATEGGAKIKGTKQRPLKEIVAQYCIQDINIDLIQDLPRTTLDWNIIKQKLTVYVKEMEDTGNQSLKQLKKLEDIRDCWEYYVQHKGIDYIFSVLSKTETYFKMVPQNDLLYHNLQGPMLIILQKFHLIPDDGSLESLKQNVTLQIEFCEMFSYTAWLIAQVIQENFPWDKEAKGEKEINV